MNLFKKRDFKSYIKSINENMNFDNYNICQQFKLIVYFDLQL